MKKLDKIAIVVQARLNSERVPQKMIRPFNGTTLFSLILDKLKSSKYKLNIFASVYEKELVDIATSKQVNLYNRSYESANNDNSLQKIYEWHTELQKQGYKYVILVSGCNPLLKISTIDKFIEQFLTQQEENLFAVIEKKTYYWNKEGKLITPWPSDQTIMNTKVVEPTLEAAHVLYASRLDLVKENRWMGDFQKEKGIKLFTMDELEAFDIDYEWQFNVAELLHKSTLPVDRY